MADLSDPAWLYSTVAQSTAALVAIVGGFLVSRLITLASEWANLARRVRELEEEEGAERDESGNLSMAVLEHDTTEVLKAAFRDLVLSEGTAPAAEVFTRHHHRGRSAIYPVFEQRYEVHADGVRKAFEALRPRFAGPTLPPLDPVEGAKQLGIDPAASLDYEAFTAVYRHLWRTSQEASVRERLRLGQQPPSLETPPAEDLDDAFYSPQQRQDLPALRDAANERADRARTNRDRAERELQRLAVPEGVGLAFGVLLYFAAAGLVLPVIVLARQPTSDWWVLRLAVVVGFVTGLAGLMWFLRRVIRGATANEA